MNTLYFDKLVYSINKTNLDGMLIVPSEELNFIAGFSPLLCERFQGLFIKKDGTYFYFCNLLTKNEVEEFLPKDKIYTWFDNDGFIDILRNVLIKENLMNCKIGLNSTARAFNILDIMDKLKVKFINGKEVLEDIRLLKTESEIVCLKEAAIRTDAVMRDIYRYIKPGISEHQIIDEINNLFISYGMTPEFAIVASGPNSALPHYTGSSRIIEKKDILLLDIGGKYKGLCSDMTRTIFIGGISEKEAKAYELVLESNLKGISAIKEGMKAKEIDKVSRDIITSGNYGDYFTTRLGHGIGYSLHEGPYINGSNELQLQNGMTFSIEPGIYIKDEFGIRIEDIVIIENGVGNAINNLDKKVVII